MSRAFEKKGDNVKSIGIYIAVFLLTIYCFFLYDDKILAMMLVIEVVFFLISMVWLYFIKQHVEVFMDSLIPIAEKNQNISVKVMVRNRSKWLGAHVKVLLIAENVFTGEKRKVKRVISAAAGKTGEMTADLQAGSCGNLTISLKKYWIMDPLFILRRKMESKERQSVSILPECHLMAIEVTRRTREFIAEADEYSDKESGNDANEIYQVREYQDMDSLRDVHWKLSAKADDLLVKEHGRPKGCAVLIWLNLQKEEQVKKRIKRSVLKQKSVSTVMLEMMASLSLSLLEADCVHMAAWYEKKNRKIQKKKISKEEHVYELLNRLLYTEEYQEDIEVQYQDAFRGVYFSSIVELKMDGRVLVNEEEKMRLSLDEMKNQWGEFYFIV